MCAVRVSFVIPSWTGEIQRLRTSLEQQTYQDFEIIVVERVSPAGLARNQGVAKARGELLVFVDDDAFLGHERVLEQMVTTIDSDPQIGVVGPSKLLPPDASWFQKRTAEEIPRWIFPVLDSDTESNPPLDSYGFTGITTTCCIVRRSAFEQVAGFDPGLEKGQDTEFFFRIRRAGYRFVIPANSWAFHDPPPSLRILLRKSFKGGMAHAIEARRNRERKMDIVPLDRWYGKLFVLASPLLFVPSIFLTYVFDPVRSLKWGFRPIKAVSTLLTLYGYVYGWYTFDRPAAPRPGEAISS